MKKIQKQLFPNSVFILLFFLFTILSCTKEGADFELNSTENSAIAQLKADFEQSKTTIRQIHFDKDTKGGTLSSELSVVWSEAKQFNGSDKIVFDIPLNSEESNCVVKTFVKGKETESNVNNCISRLIYEKYNDNSSRFYVVTMIGNHLRQNKDEITFYKNTDFTGIALISDLDGHCKAAYCMEKGVQREVGLFENEVDTPVVYNTFQMQGMTYSLGIKDPTPFFVCTNCSSYYWKVGNRYCSTCQFYIYTPSDVAFYFPCITPECPARFPLDYRGECYLCDAYICGAVEGQTKCRMCFQESCDCCFRCLFRNCLCCDKCEKFPCVCGQKICPICNQQFCNDTHGQEQIKLPTEEDERPEPKPDPEPEPDYPVYNPETDITLILRAENIENAYDTYNFYVIISDPRRVEEEYDILGVEYYICDGIMSDIDSPNWRLLVQQSDPVTANYNFNYTHTLTNLGLYTIKAVVHFKYAAPMQSAYRVITF